ncbi:MAG TPA: FAD-dependent oxidoreductase [Anaerolineae bacterium]|nr:FAD-dependent oxidoreductase [Anaerolineae bacterium]HQE98233.1 FAD-dependent oxidoreductase [Anaerolineae bacterium]HUM35326.1 FAD-dependent oxidoreductase [Anaerolineae bacterium]
MDQKELHALEAQCTQEHAPPCTAACPIHVDVRGMLAAVAADHFDAALALLTKRLPFPGIIGRVCEQPCRAACNRKDLGDALMIAALERACAAYGAPPPPKRRLPGRGKRIAVVGGGLSGVTVAHDLARKGHRVTLFEATERLGGTLWETSEDVLPRDLLTGELTQALSDGVEVKLNTPVTTALLDALHADFDAVYLGVGQGPKADFARELLAGVAPDTFTTPREGVFAAGRAIAARPTFIESISTGQRAAISIDRYLQRVSLTASREHEGAYITQLYTNLGGIAPVPVIRPTAPAAGYTRAEAVQEAQRCLQCECLECVKACAYLQHYGSYPKQYVRQIYNNLSIVMGTRQFNTLINSCSLCGLCGEICPYDLNMATICHEARQTMVAQDRMPPSAHEFALRDMAFSNGAAARLARPAPGSERCDYIFFPGCQLSASAPEHVERAYADLREMLPNVGLLLGCCGAPANWAGRSDLFAEAQAAFRADYAALGGGQVILACSTCYQMFKTHLPDVPALSLWELFSEHGLPPSAAAPRSLPGPLAVHDPCTTRHESAIHESVRQLLREMGLRIEELPFNRERTECCSYGGLMWLANREVAETIVQRRIAEQPLDYVTYCAMCRDFFADRQKPTLHLLDILYEDDLTARAMRPGPRFSQRHDNRARLKRRLLTELWEEPMSEPPAIPIQLLLSEEVAARVEKRLILEEDIREVIAYAERTGNRFHNPQTGHFLASHRPANVTYWVEYTPVDDGYQIHNAYSHRMEIVMQPEKAE